MRLEMRGIVKAFLGVQALNGVSLTVDAGQILALVGENGAGKSTLIKILSGAQRPDAGEIRIDGEPAEIHTPADAERFGIATVYQELNLFPYLSVAENLLFGRYPRRRGGIIDWRGGRREAERFLQSMGVDLAPDRPVAELSIAERQMLEIAKALHRRVRILILDEPTAVLGGHDVEQLLGMVRSLREHGVATIFISHRLDEIFGLADRYTVLKDGEPAGSGDLRDTDEDALVSMMVGRELQSLGAPETAPGAEALRVEGLTREGVLRDIHFSVRRGEVVGVAGLRGAGRTEMARAIFGADPVDAGRILRDGEAVEIGSPADAIGHGIGLVPEDRKGQGLLMNLSTARRRLQAQARHPRRRRRLARGDPVGRQPAEGRARQVARPRRRLGRNRPPNRLAMQPRPLADLPDRQPVNPVHPPDLSPLLHPDHTPSSSPIRRSSEGPDPAGRTRPRARWVTFEPAHVGHYSAGAHRPRLRSPQSLRSLGRVRREVAGRMPSDPTFAAMLAAPVGVILLPKGRPSGQATRAPGREAPHAGACRGTRFRSAGLTGRNRRAAAALRPGPGRGDRPRSTRHGAARTPRFPAAGARLDSPQRPLGSEAGTIQACGLTLGAVERRSLL